jgi:hypothetical protein
MRLVTPPAKIRKAIDLYVQMWGRRESHGIIRRIVRPHPLYSDAPRPDAGPFKIRFAPIGWRVFLKSKSGRVTALDAIRRKDGEYGFRFYVGEVAAHWLTRLRAMERRNRVAGGEYEPRLLTMPAAHLSLLWLANRSPQKNRFARLDTPGPPGKTEWMSRKDLEALIQRSISSAAEMWQAAREQ